MDLSGEIWPMDGQLAISKSVKTTPLALFVPP